MRSALNIVAGVMIGREIIEQKERAFMPNAFLQTRVSGLM
jgi:hypothetical protein